MSLLAKHHYLGDLQPVGEQMRYVAVTANGGWVALRVFSAAAKHLKAREHWAGWTELGRTTGYGRCRKEYYVKHNKPKALFVKELYRNARRSLQAEHLKPALAVVEKKVPAICEKSSKGTAVAERALQTHRGFPVPDLRYLGRRMVDTKTHEIPVAREWLDRLDVEDRLVILDALHTQKDTAREIVVEHGGDFLFTVKKNQAGLRDTLAKALADIPAGFSPLSRRARPMHGQRRAIGVGVNSVA